jgi:conjugative transfer pilus assembly protein TraH
MRIKPLALAIVLALPLPAAANMQQQVNEMFGMLVNTTSPGTYQTATRGVVTGGNVTLRNRISTSNLISITPPSAKGGCGGINLYTGSFSFVNAEEFVALMRNVASNAVGVISGFAFQLALEYMDAQTSGVIKNITGRIQQLNQMFSNSCQLASGIVSGGIKAFEEKRGFKAAAETVMDSVAPDFFAGRSQKEGTAFERLKTSGKMKPCEFSGNIMWCALKKVGFTTQVLYGSDETAEFVMSMTGSRIVSLADDNRSGKSPKSQPLQATITDDALQLFVNGTNNSNIRIWSCDSGDECLEPEEKAITSFKGLKTRIVEDVETSGAFSRFAQGQGTPADGARLQYLAASRVGVNLFRILQKNGEQDALDYFNEFAQAIALGAAYTHINQMLDFASSSLSSVDFPEAGLMLDQVRDVRTRLQVEWQKEISEGTSFRDADRRAAEILAKGPTFDPGRLVQGAMTQSAGN